MDTDGYPDEIELEQIRKWDCKDITGLLEFVEDRWAYPDRFQKTGNKYYLSTGGWSGNESLIGALHDHWVFWACCWLKSERGGHYWFEIRECDKEKK